MLNGDDPARAGDGGADPGAGRVLRPRRRQRCAGRHGDDRWAEGHQFLAHRRRRAILRATCRLSARTGCRSHWWPWRSAHAFGMHISEMLAGLQDPDTQVRLLFAPGPGGSDLIDDTYNAARHRCCRRWVCWRKFRRAGEIAVLGEMRELGRISEDEHRVVGRRAGAMCRFADHLRSMPPGWLPKRPMAMAAGSTTRSWSIRSPKDEKDAIVALLRTELRAGDVVLFKGSRGLAMETIVRDLRADVECPPMPDRPCRGRRTIMMDCSSYWAAQRPSWPR